MIDICKCNGEKCKAKKKCLRFIIEPIEYGQSWADFYKQPKNKKGQCGQFIEVKK